MGASIHIAPEGAFSRWGITLPGIMDEMSGNIHILWVKRCCVAERRFITTSAIRFISA